MEKKRISIKKITFVAGGALGLAVIPVVAVTACGSTSTRVVSFTNVPAYAYAGTSMAGKGIYTILSDPENPRWQKALSDINAASSEAGFTTRLAQIQKSQDDQNTALAAAANSPSYNGYILGASKDGGFGSQMSSITANKPKAPIIAYDRLIKQNNANYN